MTVSELVKGHWYRSPSGNIFKFDKVDHNIRASEHLILRSDYSYEYKNTLLLIPIKAICTKVSLLDIQQYLPDGYIDTAPSVIKPLITQDFPDITYKELDVFPITGWCKSFNLKLIVYLHNKYPNNKAISSRDMIGTAWNDKGFWAVVVKSNRTEYTVDQLNKFINPKLNQSEQSRTKSSRNNEIPISTSEDKRTIIRGAIAVRHRRQQVTVGSRPKGNITSINTGSTKSCSIEIKKNVIKSRYT